MAQLQCPRQLLFREVVESRAGFIGGSVGATIILLLGGLLLWAVAILLNVCSRVILLNVGYSAAVVASLVLDGSLGSTYKKAGKEEQSSMISSAALGIRKPSRFFMHCLIWLCGQPWRA